jgi:hypothetical protein
MEKEYHRLQVVEGRGSKLQYKVQRTTHDPRRTRGTPAISPYMYMRCVSVLCVCIIHTYIGTA